MLLGANVCVKSLSDAHCITSLVVDSLSYDYAPPHTASYVFKHLSSSSRLFVPHTWSHKPLRFQKTSARQWRQILPRAMATTSSEKATLTAEKEETDLRPQEPGHNPGTNGAALVSVGRSTNIMWHESIVTSEERRRQLGQRGCVIWLTGLSGSGKSTLACTLDHALWQRGKLSYVLDGDNIRHGLNKNLGFSAEDRAENIRRVGEVAKLFADAGFICITSFISPYKEDRDACRKLLPPGDFIEVYMKVPIEICEQRDPKGLYKLARAGKIKGFTGIDDPYEEPEHAEIVMDAGALAPTEMAQTLVERLVQSGFLENESAKAGSEYATLQ
eukprot:jgi/Mesen1/493/ME000104S10586